ncbi:MAG TPA: PsiF family protein [Burkholderiaceae bacterium]|nr:PsiF family protein [Burkholderiaceae bacterium]
MLKHVLIAACLALPLAAVAADDKKPVEKKEMTPQQQKMASCNKEAGDKKLAGDERKTFMSTCLSAGGGKKMTQQDKMTYCNKEAGDKKLAGEDRKKFMSSCLSG